MHVVFVASKLHAWMRLLLADGNAEASPGYSDRVVRSWSGSRRSRCSLPQAPDTTVVTDAVAWIAFDLPVYDVRIVLRHARSSAAGGQGEPKLPTSARPLILQGTVIVGRERYSEEQREFYTAYLASPAWRAWRASRLALAGNRCEFDLDGVRCVRIVSLEVHHETYERLGHEQDSDLTVLCWFHHQLEHLLWKRCACGAPCIGDDKAATHWLLATLYAMGIDPEALPSRKDLPNKEVFLVQVPDECTACCPFLGEDE